MDIKVKEEAVKVTTKRNVDFGMFHYEYDGSFDTITLLLRGYCIFGYDCKDKKRL